MLISDKSFFFFAIVVVIISRLRVTPWFDMEAGLLLSTMTRFYFNIIKFIFPIFYFILFFLHSFHISSLITFLCLKSVYLLPMF